jgi:uncharacterized protein YrrD
MHPFAPEQVGTGKGHPSPQSKEDIRMKKLLATTALTLMVSTPLLAQQAQPGAQPEGAQTQEMQQPMTMQGELFLPAGQEGALHASELIGMAVHSSESDYGMYSGAPVTAADRTDWDAIGEVNDILISREGDAQGVLVDIGGFLGIGARTVALDMSQIHFLQDENGDRFIAVNSTREALENAPEYQREDEMAAADGRPSDAAMTTPQAEMAADPVAPAQDGQMAADPAVTPPGSEMAADPMIARPTFTREGYQDVDYNVLTAEDLQGATVYDGNDDNIGSISDLVLSTDGAIDQAVVDVGGFLGIGAHSVALDFDEMQILRNADGSDLRVYIDQTRENLEQRPAFEG